VIPLCVPMRQHVDVPIVVQVVVPAQRVIHTHTHVRGAESRTHSRRHCGRYAWA
jgi:hypothetical protein